MFWEQNNIWLHHLHAQILNIATKDVEEGIRFHRSQLLDLWYSEAGRVEEKFEMQG